MTTPRAQDLLVAYVTEKDGVLVIAQSNGPALRDLRNTLIAGFGMVPVLLFGHFLLGLPVGALLFMSLPLLWLLARSVNRFFGKETFIFDKNKGVFIRNGTVVSALKDIRSIKAQVTRGEGQNPTFRLVVELPGQTVPLVTTNYVPAPGDFSLSGNGFGDPNKRFAICEPWLDYGEQSLIPFLPPEIVEFRRTVSAYFGEQVVH